MRTSSTISDGESAKTKWREYKTAKQYVQEGLVLKPDAHYIWDTLAWLYVESGKQQMAVEASTRALSLAPENQRDS